VKKKLPELTDFMELITVTGLRYNEAIESYNLVVSLAKKKKTYENTIILKKKPWSTSDSKRLSFEGARKYS